MSPLRTLLALSCCLAAADASARVVAVPRAGVSAPAAAYRPLSASLGAPALALPLSPASLTPALSVPALGAPVLALSPAALAPLAAAPLAAAQAAPVAPLVAAPAAPLAAAPLAASEASPAAPLAALEAAGVDAEAAIAPDSSAASAKADADRSFDLTTRRAATDDLVIAPAPAPARRRLLGRASAAAAGVFAVPGAALAAATPLAVEPGALSLLLTYAPLTSVLTAVLGALFGLWSARREDASAGAALASALSYGAIAGAAAFALIDLARFAFLGAAGAALTPLTAAVATAALAQTAFAPKFILPATTPAERVLGAFPAVAMAFGLSLAGTTLLAPSLLLTAATAMLMATGAATALYTALFRLDRSPAEGPAAMGRGFVLQALMTGLSLALGPTPYGLFFFALGAWGFIGVMRATLAELLSALPPSFRDRFKR